MAINEATFQQFLDKMLDDAGAAMGIGLVLLGDKLGLYKALAAAGPLTSSELASRTGTAARYVREWAAAQAAGGYQGQMPSIPANTPRGMKTHQMSCSSLLTPAARNRRRSSRLFMVYSSSRLLAMRKLAWRTDLWSASGAIAPPRRTIVAFPEKLPRYAFVRR
jgi:hypothetical protein